MNYLRSHQSYSQSVKAKNSGSVSLKMLSAMKLNELQDVDIQVLWRHRIGMVSQSVGHFDPMTLQV